MNCYIYVVAKYIIIIMPRSSKLKQNNKRNRFYKQYPVSSDTGNSEVINGHVRNVCVAMKMLSLPKVLLKER